MDAGIIWDAAYAEHDTADHPEGADRVVTIVEHLQASDLWPRLVEAKPQPASEADVLRVHTQAHVERVRAAAERGGEWLDADTYVSPRSFEVALLSAGGAIKATELWSEGIVASRSSARPVTTQRPSEAMGFCLFNNIAIAAARRIGAAYERVAIVDWDVHHGNGTQDAFYGEPRRALRSLHQWPLYPGSGFFTECGEGAGPGLHRQRAAARRQR